MRLRWDDLFTEDGTGWSDSQQTKDNNGLAIDSFAHTGQQALKCIADPTADGASKSSLFQNDMAFYEGSIVEFSAWYYLDETEDRPYLFIMDLEESAPISAGPGIRIATEPDGGLFLERKKMIENDIYQSPDTYTTFPKQEWVQVTLRVKLSQKKQGWIQLYQNSQLLIEANNVRTLPKDFLYAIQGTAGLYTNIEVGITANSPEGPTTLFVDDVLATSLN